MMECPTCFQRIIVPQSPATDDIQLIIKGQKAEIGKRPVPTAVTGLGTTTPPAKKFPMAAIVLVVLLCGVIVAMFVFHGKIFESTGGQTGQVTTVSKVSTVSNQVQKLPPAPAEVVTVVPPGSSNGWTLNLGDVVIPDSVAAGYIHGKALIPEWVILDGGTLTLRTANEGLPDVGVSIYFQTKQSEDFAGRAINIESSSVNVPWIDLRWKDEHDQPMKQTVKGGYALRLEFGQLAGNHLPGKIYLCTPDETKSYVIGTFDAKVRKSKPSG